MENLEQIKTQLTKLGYRLSVAESLSTGNLQSSIGGITGATSYFEGGITVYSLDQKVNLLNIDEDHAMTVNCVSERVAKEMAIGVCKLFNTQIGISTTGYAEPNEEMKIEIESRLKVKKEIKIIENPSVILNTFSKLQKNTYLFSSL